MQHAEFMIGPLHQAPDRRITATVMDTAGRPLSRRVLLYHANGMLLAHGRSDIGGQVEFVLTGAGDNDRYILRAFGKSGECDAVSCRLRAAEI